MRRSVLTVVALLLLHHALPVYAQDITFTQSSGGAITATLTETTGACGGGVGGILSIVQTGGTFTIDSGVAVPSPGPCGPPIIITYQVSALLGSLPDGRYD